MDAAFRAAEAHGIRAIIGKVMMDRVTYDPTIEPTTILDAFAARVRGPHRALARRRRRPPRLCGHAALRDLLHRRHAARIRVAGAVDRCVVADPRGRGPVRDRRGPSSLPRGARLCRRLRPGRWPRVADRPRPRHPPLRSRARPAGRDRHARRALPGLEPVPRRRRDAAGALPAGRALGRPRVGRLGRPRPLDLLGDAGRRLRPEGAAVAGRRRAAPCWPRSTGCGSGRSTAPGRSGSTTSSGRSRPARRPTSSSSIPSFVAPLDGQPPDDDPADLASRLIFRAHPDMVRAPGCAGGGWPGPGRRRPVAPEIAAWAGVRRLTRSGSCRGRSHRGHRGCDADASTTTSCAGTASAGRSRTNRIESPRGRRADCPEPAPAVPAPRPVAALDARRSCPRSSPGSPGVRSCPTPAPSSSCSSTSTRSTRTGIAAWTVSRLPRGHRSSRGPPGGTASAPGAGRPPDRDPRPTARRGRPADRDLHPGEQSCGPTRRRAGRSWTGSTRAWGRQPSTSPTVRVNLALLRRLVGADRRSIGDGGSHRRDIDGARSAILDWHDQWAA